MSDAQLDAINRRRPWSCRILQHGWGRADHSV